MRFGVVDMRKRASTWASGPGLVMQCRCEYVIHLGFTSLIHLRDGLFQLFMGNNLMD